MSFDQALLYMGLASMGFAAVLTLWLRHEAHKLDREYGRNPDER